MMISITEGMALTTIAYSHNHTKHLQTANVMPCNTSIVASQVAEHIT